MNNQEHMRAFFDALAPKWQVAPDSAAVCADFVEKMDLPAESIIADIGCGKGVMLAHLLPKARKLYAIDLSPVMIAGARAAFDDERIDFISGDFFELDLPLLDAAVFFNSYPHFLDKEALVEKLASQIRPGGVLVICHNASRQVINSRHSASHDFILSCELLPAVEEAQRFSAAFTLAEHIDSPECYFLRLVR